MKSKYKFLSFFSTVPFILIVFSCYSFELWTIIRYNMYNSFENYKIYIVKKNRYTLKLQSAFKP